MAPPFKYEANPAEGYGGGVNPPSVNLWIGNLASDISETQLKALLEKYGEVESIVSYPSRNYAFVYFKNVEDAKSAKDGLQGYVVHGNALKIEFAKSARPCKTLWVAGICPSVPKDEVEKKFRKFGQIQEFRFLKDRSTAYVDYVNLDDATEALKDMNGKRIGGSQIRVDYLRSISTRRQPFVSIGSRKGDSPLSNVLLIRHPPSFIIEEDMLHNAMILFGEIEKIKTFNDRNYAFVEFRSAEEARRAKEGLQGKLFNDPQISIEFFTTEFPGGGGQAGDYLIQAAQMGMVGLNTGLAPLGIAPVGIRESDLYVRPVLVPHSNFRPALHGAEYIDLAAVHKLQNTGTRGLIGEPNWGRSSPTHVISKSAKPILNAPKRSASGAWDVLDGNLLNRDSKRARFEAGLHPEMIESQGGLDEQYGRRQVSSMGDLGSRARTTTGGLGKRHSDGDCMWQGLIAKGGTPVCHARCVAIGNGFDSEIPKVVNCSARTGLDLLTKHYEDAIGFDIAFFLPDSEVDFASYTEFLRYLSSKDRAGVAKFDDGTTLFLVPPSTFLSQVLKVSGPERLYGVVLKFPPVAPISSAMNSRPTYPSQVDPRNLAKLQTGYSNNTPNEGRVSPLDYSKVPVEEPTMLPRSHGPVTSSFPAQSVPSTTAGSQVGLALTPELIATLTSFLPGNDASGPRPNPPVIGTTSNLVTGADTNVVHWKQEHQAIEQNGQLVQLLGGQFSSQLQHLQTVQPAPVVPNLANNFNMTRNLHNQVDDQSITLTQAPLSSNSYAPVNPLQPGPGSVAQEGNQRYQQGGSYDVSRGHGANDRADAQRFYNSSVAQQTAYPVSLSTQVHAGGVSMPQPFTPVPPPEILSHQSQPIQPSQLGAVQENAETEADKNERYKTTLLFAANLLSQIHQTSGNQQPGQGAGSH